MGLYFNWTADVSSPCFKKHSFHFWSELRQVKTDFFKIISLTDSPLYLWLPSHLNYAATLPWVVKSERPDHEYNNRIEGQSQKLGKHDLKHFRSTALQCTPMGAFNFLLVFYD